MLCYKIKCFYFEFMHKNRNNQSKYQKKGKIEITKKNFIYKEK